MVGHVRDRDLKDVFKVQDEIAAAVVKALQVKLLSTPVKAESEPHDADASASTCRDSISPGARAMLTSSGTSRASGRPSRWRLISHQPTLSLRRAPTCTSSRSGAAHRRA